MNLRPKSSLLRQESNFGLAARATLFVLTMLVCFAIASAFRFLAGAELIPFKVLVAMFLVTAIPIGVGLILAELPRGESWVLMRLGVATFCRTGLPLLIVILVEQILTGVITEHAFGFLAFFYLVGFFSSVWISVNRFKVLNSQTKPLREVNRAAV